MWRHGLGEKWILAAVGTEGAMVAEKGKKERSTQGNAQGEHFLIAFGLENERG